MHSRRAASMMWCWMKCCLLYALLVVFIAKRAYAPSSTTIREKLPSSLEDSGDLQDDDPLRAVQTREYDEWEDNSSSVQINEESVVHVDLSRVKCCYRHRKYYTIGFDTFARRPIKKDVGRCRRTYTDSPVSTIDTTDDVKRRGRHGSLPCDQCEDGNMCLPTRILLERSLYANAWSPLDYEVIDDCHCVRKTHPCKRVSFLKVFHHNTPYETTVDVGECRGKCSSSHDTQLECQATRNKTETVIGPNGHECVAVITRCSCVGSCFRATHMVAFYTRTYNETTGAPYDSVQELDVGKCLGKCTKRKGICIRHTNCEAVLLPKTYCSPKEYVPHIFHAREGGDFIVHVINECRCM